MQIAIDTADELTACLTTWAGSDGQRRAVAATIDAIACSTVVIASVVARGQLRQDLAKVTGQTPDGDDQKRVDVVTDQLAVDALRAAPVAVVGSEERDEPLVLAPEQPLAVAIDPLDGSANIDIAAPIGTIFSILPVTDDAPASLLQAGTNQLAAGLVVYGVTTTLVLTVGDGTDIYVLDPETDRYVRVARRVEVPKTAQEFAINASNRRHWTPAVRAYIEDLLDGAGGPRGADFNMRWLGAVVAEAYRILRRGGIYLYPGDARPGYEQGRLRLVYEANPIAFVMEQAGGAATDGRNRILDLTPASLHERTPLVFGSAEKVARVARYIDGEPFRGERSPLFNPRSLFRDRDF